MIKIKDMVMTVLFLLVSFSFLQTGSALPFCNAPRTAERNVNLNKNTSENVASNAMFHPDERAPSSFFKTI